MPYEEVCFQRLEQDIVVVDEKLKNKVSLITV